MNDIEGIWIQEEFKHSFDKTKSINKSKFVFSPELPVALRLNRKEIIDSILNIGYSVLHDHSRHPEVSRFLIQGKDTVYEQGSLLVDLRLNKGQMPFNVGYIPYFNAENRNSYLSIKRTKFETILYLVNENSDTLRYVRYTKEFDKENQYPNPLYNYTLNHTLVGQYQLYSQKEGILSQSIIIKDNGDITGHKDFEMKKIYYSTDNYCGSPNKHDVALICEYPATDYVYNIEVCQAYIIKKNKKGDIILYVYNWDDQIGSNFSLKKEVKYTLKKK